MEGLGNMHKNMQKDGNGSLAGPNQNIGTNKSGLKATQLQAAHLLIALLPFRIARSRKNIEHELTHLFCNVS